MNTKAVRIHGKNDLRLDEITLPEVGPDDVQVKIVCDSVCMSTYKAALEGEDHKRVPNDVAENPTIVGHEFCGQIIAVGDNWKDKYKVGDNFSIQPAHFHKGSQLAPATPTSTAAAMHSMPTSPLRLCWRTACCPMTPILTTTALWLSL